MTGPTTRPRASYDDWTVPYRQMGPHPMYDLVFPDSRIPRADAARLAYTALLSYGYRPGGTDHPTWQAAWNHLTGASDDRPGVLTIADTECLACHGRGYLFSGNNLIRSVTAGLPQGTCAECRGTRRSGPIRLRTRAAAD